MPTAHSPRYHLPLTLAAWLPPPLLCWNVSPQNGQCPSPWSHQAWWQGDGFRRRRGWGRGVGQGSETSLVQNWFGSWTGKDRANPTTPKPLVTAFPCSALPPHLMGYESNPYPQVAQVALVVQPSPSTSGTFWSSQTETLYSLNNRSPFSLPRPRPLSNHYSTFCLYDFIILGISYKWNHIIFVFLCLAYFT